MATGSAALPLHRRAYCASCRLEGAPSSARHSDAVERVRARPRSKSTEHARATTAEPSAGAQQPSYDSHPQPLPDSQVPPSGAQQQQQQQQQQQW